MGDEDVIQDIGITPQDFSEYILRQLKNVFTTGNTVSISTILDYGYFDDTGSKADIDDEDANDVDYRNPRIQIVTISTISSKSKEKHFNMDRKIYYIDISEDGNHTILSMKQAKNYTTKGVENHIEEAAEILRKVFKPFYPGFDSYTGYPINSVVTDADSLRNIYKYKYSDMDNKTAYRRYIREMFSYLIAHCHSRFIVFGDDGEESKWESETDRLNRIKILYTLFSTKPYDDSLGVSNSSVINAITHLNI